MKVLSTVKSYALIIIAFLLVGVVSSEYSSHIQRFVTQSGEEGDKLLFYGTVAILFAIGFFVYYLAKSTSIPSFVMVIFFGFAGKDLLDPLFHDPFVVNVLVTLGAVFILFGGGLETPYKDFKKFLAHILSLAFLGTFLTSLMLSGTLLFLSQLVGLELPLPVVVLLGFALSSTDPAAIIPCFQNMVFKKSRVKYIAISESALNDVVGAVFALLFLSFFEEGIVFANVIQAYAHLFTLSTALVLIKSLGVGIIVGIVGYFVLEFWHRFKNKIKTQEETDNAFFMVMPFLVFTVSQVFGGSGFLASFLSALVFKMKDPVKHVEHYFNSTVGAFLKPMIFIILGAMVDLDQLIAYAPIGILVALIFIFIIRPITVFISLGPFAFLKDEKKRIDLNELLFLSFVRETGVIPAALIVTLSASGVAGSSMILAIGMWVILLTLIIQPPLTPLFAKKLNIAEPIQDHTDVQIAAGAEPAAVLVTRGGSFLRRLPIVIKWAVQHNIYHIAILFSPEEKYNQEYIEEKQHQAHKMFHIINDERSENEEDELEFEFIVERGYLSDNIRRYAKTHDNISIIFAGKRMIDFRAEDIKNLKIPLFFID
jgi:NhaP-type Na+/H+ or K+/H+ antiporter